ncbi:MAG: alanine--tRNA ligase [Solirubrobacterales bacterium]
MAKGKPLSSAQIRETYLSFFEQRDHARIASASLVPSAYDPSVLLTTAGMQPFKPHFLGREDPPHPRLTSCQKCFRTTDIDQVGNTARHLTFFEMLGNFSFGDYFKQGAVEFAWELSTQGFGFDPQLIWITVFEGDAELGLGPDEEAIDVWRSVGVPDERIVRLPRSENFWQAGSVGPCGPCSELYLDRGPEFGPDDDRPGDDTERFLEFWNLVFMQYSLGENASLAPLPKQSIDTGLGLDRMAAILQDVPSVFETDQFKPLLDLGEQMSRRRYGDDRQTTRALRILADHGRAMTFLIADGVVPSNEDRGYILRRIMRRAIQQGRAIGLASPFLTPFADRVVETMGDAYPGLGAERKAIHEWLASEEENFGRTLEQGTVLLAELVAGAQASKTSWIAADDAFKLHDTYGFPYDLTRELLAEDGLSVDDAGFHELMEEQRKRARTGSASAHGSERDHGVVTAFAREAGFTSRFVGYEQTDVQTSVAAFEQSGDLLLAKFPESPFYAEGGGQVADSGTIETESGRARVDDVFRLGDDQAVAVAVEQGEVKQGERVRLRVDAVARHATAANHTATHLLHAALRERLGEHVRQAGSAVRPDKLRFDFTHGKALGPQELAEIEDRVNQWVVENRPVRAFYTTRARAEELGAMALFGEKYGDEVRVVEVEDVSRELCGGTHVWATSQIGVFKILGEGSSAANVRRIEAATGPQAVALLRDRDRALEQIAAQLRTRPEGALAAVEDQIERVRELERQHKAGGGGLDQIVNDVVAGATEVDGIKVATGYAPDLDQDALRDIVDRVKGKLVEGVVVVGSTMEGKGMMVAGGTALPQQRGVNAAEVLKSTASEYGGGGGGRHSMATAGMREADKVEPAIKAAGERLSDLIRAST